MNHLESSIEVMEPPDLLQWLHGARKTGVCRFSRGAAVRRIYFRGGEIVACSSNEPHLLLGQFLIANGKIDVAALRECMKIQEATGRSLGEILVESGKADAEELESLVSAKAEETILGLFEWPRGNLRFDPDVAAPSDSMSVDLDVQALLLEGARRIDENERIRRVFVSREVVLHRTERPPEASSLAGAAERRLYESIDGRRTLADLILHCRSSDFLACSFLARLVERGSVRLGEVREATGETTERGSAVGALQAMVARQQYEDAIDLIERNEFERDGDDLLSMLIAKTEAAYLAAAYRTHTPPHAIPRKLVDGSPGDEQGLSGAELFVLDLLDKQWDVRSLVWIAPMRKVETIRALKGLLDRGYVEMQVPDPGESGREMAPVPSSEELEGAIEQAIGVSSVPVGST